jgi:hypothetical protein
LLITDQTSFSFCISYLVSQINVFVVLHRLSPMNHISN